MQQTVDQHSEGRDGKILTTITRSSIERVCNPLPALVLISQCKVTQLGNCCCTCTSSHFRKLVGCCELVRVALRVRAANVDHISLSYDGWIPWTRVYFAYKSRIARIQYIKYTETYLYVSVAFSDDLSDHRTSLIGRSSDERAWISRRSR